MSHNISGIMESQFAETKFMHQNWIRSHKNLVRIVTFLTPKINEFFLKDLEQIHWKLSAMPKSMSSFY